jgi:hypothetical protein
MTKKTTQLQDKYLLYTVTDQNVALLVPDLWQVTKRNGNSMSADFTQNTIEND